MINNLGDAHLDVWSDAQSGGDWIAIGALRLAADDIVSCRVEDVHERDFAGRVATLGLLFASVLVLLLGLIEFDWRVRAVLGAVALGTIALAAGLETLGINRTVYYRLDLVLRDGRHIRYTTSSRSDAERLAESIHEDALA